METSPPAGTDNRTLSHDPDPSRIESPSVAVVVVHWGDPEVTLRCLESLKAVEYHPRRVLVVDNGSPDRAGRGFAAAFPDIRVLRTERNLGYTGGGNLGIRHALAEGADHVLLLNNDAELLPDALTRLVAAARSGPRVGAVAPRILHHDDPSRVWYAGGRLDLVRGLGMHDDGDRCDSRAAERTEPVEVTFLTGCCLLLPAPVLRDAGGLAEDYFAYVEDAELSHRLLRRGYRLLYEPRARILHRVSEPTEAPGPLQIHLRDRNRRRFARDHLGPLARMRFMCWYYPTRLLRLAQYVLRGDGPRARAILTGMGLPGRRPEGLPDGA